MGIPPRPRVPFSVRGDLIGGTFRIPQDPNGEWEVRSPANLSDQIGKFSFSYKAIDGAVQAARGAFQKWAETSIHERANFLKKYQEVLQRRQGEIAECIAREIGKPLWETHTEVSAAINKVDVTLVDGKKLIENFEVPGALENAQGACRFRPRGVLAILGPFPFPAHLPNSHWVPALLAGNAVIFKPSEKAPMTGQLMAECLLEAGIPSGVFNLLQGEKEMGRRLCIHEGVDGILFSGSSEVGSRIKQDILQQHWKLLVLGMGGKNPALVWEDAPLEHAVQETLVGAFLTAGQRCTSTSRILVHKNIFEPFKKLFHERAKAFSIGHPFTNPFMGPLIDASSVDRYLKFLGMASREGCEMVMRGKHLELEVEGHYVAPSICWVKDSSLMFTRKSVYQQTELLVPNVALLKIEELEEAISLANATQYGLVASVFSANQSIYEKCLDGLQFGLINWNKSTVGASSRLPFGGLKKSGNHFPGALFSTLYCSVPISSLETRGENTETHPSYPGLNWK